MTKLENYNNTIFESIKNINIIKIIYFFLNLIFTFFIQPPTYILIIS